MRAGSTGRGRLKKGAIPHNKLPGLSIELVYPDAEVYIRLWRPVFNAGGAATVLGVDPVLQRGAIATPALPALDRSCATGLTSWPFEMTRFASSNVPQVVHAAMGEANVDA